MSSSVMKEFASGEICRYLDHAVLKPEMTQKEAADAIRMGIEYKVRTVCVRPCDIQLALDLCKGTETAVSVVLAFPHGTVPSAVKAAEATLYTSLGVAEIDMVANYGYIRSGEWELVEKDIRSVSEVTKPAGIGLKVIFETSALTLEEVEKTTEICIRAGADFVKTSTGFYGTGATKEVVEVMLRTAAGRIKVKPSGGIRDAETARMYIEMGCHRLGVGSSSTPALCGGAASNGNTGY